METEMPAEIYIYTIGEDTIGEDTIGNDIMWDISRESDYWDDINEYPFTLYTDAMTVHLHRCLDGICIMDNTPPPGLDVDKESLLKTDSWVNCDGKYWKIYL